MRHQCDNKSGKRRKTSKEFSSSSRNYPPLIAHRKEEEHSVETLPLGSYYTKTPRIIPQRKENVSPITIRVIILQRKVHVNSQPGLRGINYRTMLLPQPQK
ncbi:hypothetical protein BH13170 [Bartonella henselae str. Houston-1]|uniref:Uncharacterized protein n=1 Tax=Bartonella henselae (strain ATCC 49882 / DSM 28221 / CCUG 30454 / Houston 1) TaxID=283166 RepID=A0A0H3LZF8_BARHE|nr:hypothetical protein BH13170 [Bartonella henselae str. Houston-1]